MVRNYIKKTKRVLASPSKIRRGLQLLKNGYSLSIAAQESGVNFQCLNRLKKKQGILESDLDKLPQENSKLSHKSRTVFAEELEASIAEYCTELSLIGYGLSCKKVCDLAYETAVKNKEINPDLKIPASWEKNKTAGNDWFQGESLSTCIYKQKFEPLFS